MRGFLSIAAFLALMLGLAIGSALAPRYTPPREAGQGRLRARAEAFYRALRQMDYGAAARMMTPARQYAETKELAGKISSSASDRAKFKPGTLASLAKAAQTIHGDKLDVWIEGNWGTTKGSALVYEKGQEVRLPLDALVWVWSDGDWWNYSLATAELAAYGNPPDFARELLFKPGLRDFSLEGEPPPPGEGSAPRRGKTITAPPPPTGGAASAGGAKEGGGA